MIFHFRAAAALAAALLVAAPAMAGSDYSPAKKGQYPSPNFNAPDADRITLRGTTSTGEIPNMTVSGTPLSSVVGSIDGKPLLNGRYGYFGRMSFDAAGNYIQDGGGVFLGGPQGVLLRQEGFASDKEEGSAALYPQTPNRAGLLSIAPSGNPDDIPTENVTGLALQMLNGSCEERLTLSAKKFGPNVRTYRIAPFSHSGCNLWPLEIGNGNAVIQEYNTDKSTNFTNRNYGASSSAGNTVVNIVNPAHSNKTVHFARQNGVIGQEIWQGGAYAYEWDWQGSGPAVIGTQPTISLRETDTPADARLWWLDVAGGEFRGMAATDAASQVSQWLGVNRAGSYWNEIAFGGPAGSAGTFALVRDGATGTINVVGRFLRTFANDAAAAAATPPVPLKGLYNDASGAVRVRLN